MSLDSEERELDLSNGCGDWGSSHDYPERRYSMTSDSGATFTGDLDEFLGFEGHDEEQNQDENDENTQMDKENTPSKSTPLKSCMSTQRHSRKSNKVMFGPPKAAEFDSSEPVSRMTPMNKEAVETRYKMDENDDSSDSDESQNTATNSQILAAWGEDKHEEKTKQERGSQRESSSPMDLKTLLDTEVSFKNTPTHSLNKRQLERLSSREKDDDGEDQTRTLEDLQQLLRECNDDEDNGEDDYSTESEKSPSNSHSGEERNQESEKSPFNSHSGEERNQENEATQEKSPQQATEGDETDEELENFRQREDQLLMSFNITPKKRSATSLNRKTPGSRSSSRKRERSHTPPQSATSTSSKTQKESTKRRRSFQPYSKKQLIELILSNRSEEIKKAYAEHGMTFEAAFWQYPTRPEIHMVGWTKDMFYKKVDELKHYAQDCFDLIDRTNTAINLSPENNTELQNTKERLETLKDKAQNVAQNRLREWTDKFYFRWENSLEDFRSNYQRETDKLTSIKSDLENWEHKISGEISHQLDERVSAAESEKERHEEHEQELDSKIAELEKQIANKEHNINSLSGQSQNAERYMQAANKAATQRARSIAVCISGGWAPRDSRGGNQMDMVPRYFDEAIREEVSVRVPHDLTRKGFRNPPKLAWEPTARSTDNDVHLRELLEYANAKQIGDNLRQFSKSLVSFNDFLSTLKNLHSEFECFVSIPTTPRERCEVVISISSLRAGRKVQLIIPLQLNYLGRVRFQLSASRIVDIIGASNIQVESLYRDSQGCPIRAAFKVLEKLEQNRPHRKS